MISDFRKKNPKHLCITRFIIVLAANNAFKNGSFMNICKIILTSMLKQYFAAFDSFTLTLFKHTSGLQLTSPVIPAMLIILRQVMGFLLVGRMTSPFRCLHTWHRACGLIPLSQTKHKTSLHLN